MPGGRLPRFVVLSSSVALRCLSAAAHRHPAAADAAMTRRRAPQATEPCHHVPRMGVPMDTEGFTLVQSRRRWCRRAPERPHRPRPVPLEFVGKCSNCLSGDHVHADCTFPSRCYYCHSSRHQARNCKREHPVSGHTNAGTREPPRN
ncbi:unnamed protein product [Miscanthus lutarioriparius]|uniref:CCHC-type domain-containing protein n=1 Tax=Miscanthus lutarioriparius TaxID=422564 RepID=A0A811RLL0_9POAL|nr:unnamed protein product [Miscanthus lutarioriparius]